MKILLKLTLLQFKMLLRNKALLVSSIGLAVVSMLIFGSLFGNSNARPLAVGVVDLDKSPTSLAVVAALKANPALSISERELNGLVEALKNGKQSAVVVIEPGFGANLAGATAQVQFYVDEADLIGAARSRGVVNGVFDAIGKQASGFKDPVQVAEQKVSVRKQRQIDVLTPGMLGMTIMWANIMVGVALIGWRERGTLKRLSATPLKAWQLIGSQVLSQLCLSFGQGAAILAIAAAVFGVQVRLEWLPTIAFLILAGAFSIVALGYAVGNFIKKQEAASSTITLISIPMMFLGGSYFVVEPPAFLKPLVEVLPLTHLNRALRQVMLNDSDLSAVALNLGVLTLIGVVLLTFSVRTFKWSK